MIANVGAQVENAVGLVYVAAMAPDEGEAMLDVAADYLQTLILDALRPASVAPSVAEADFVVDPAQFRAAFAADLPEEQTRVLAVTQWPFVGEEAVVDGLELRPTPRSGVVEVGHAAHHVDVGLNVVLPGLPLLDLALLDP